VLDGRRQTWAGTADLVEGREYVLFLWHSPSGLNLIIGLSQGLFAVDAANSDALQASTSEPMVDGSGAVMTADPMRMSLGEMHNYVKQAIAEGR
jgi:ketol-acid reductoisomerase